MIYALPLFQGEWTAAARLRTPSDIVNEYFEESIRILEGKNHAASLGQVSFTYAKFADKQYRELQRSGEVARLHKSTQRLQVEVSATQQASQHGKEVQKVLDWKTRIYREDQEKLTSLLQLETSYLSAALKMYLNCLAHEDKHDDVVFRFVSLWFDQHSDEQLNTALRDFISLVPTFKFVRVSHQLSARLSIDPHSKFQALLSELVIRLCQDHPFHTIFQIMLLQRGIQSTVTDVPASSRSRRISQLPDHPKQLSPSDLSRAKASIQRMGTVRSEKS